MTFSSRRTILLYAAAMIAVLAVVSPAVGLFVVPISFLLKNKLHLSANGLASRTVPPPEKCFAFFDLPTRGRL